MQAALYWTGRRAASARTNCGECMLRVSNSADSAMLSDTHPLSSHKPCTLTPATIGVATPVLRSDSERWSSFVPALGSGPDME